MSLEPLGPPPSSDAGAFVRFLGIDQTGAATRGGRGARPLPAVWLVWDGSWRLDASDGDRPRTVPRLDADVAGEGTAVMVDAVLGLPGGVAADAGLAPGVAGLRALWRRAGRHEHEGRAWGRAPGQAFFGALPHGDRLLRRADALSGAQSVFRATPWQRNVQTGTYRIWRDLGAGPDGVTVWPFEPRDARPRLHETWPTLAWRGLRGRGPRAPEALPALLDRLGVDARGEDRAVLVASADHADAAVAALWGAVLQARGRLAAPYTGFAPPRDEGWIVGLGPDGKPV